MVRERRKCPICGKEFSTERGFFNKYDFRQINAMKLELHCLAIHREGVFLKKRIFIYVIQIFTGKIIRLIEALIWIVTLPFWAVHEWCE